MCSQGKVSKRVKAANEPSQLVCTALLLDLLSSSIGSKCKIDLAGSFVTHTARGFILFEMSGIRLS